MTEYQIQPITRRCAKTGKELQPGEKFFTALLEEGDHFRREDYSVDAWQGLPAGAFSFWMGKVPPPQQSARPRIDDDLLEECFHRLEGQMEATKVNFRYVVGLLLVRRKRYKLESSRTEDGLEKLAVRCVRSGTTYEVINPRLSDEEMSAVQEEVVKVLGWG